MRFHAREIVGVFFQLLRIVFDLVLAGDVLGHRLADVDEQRAGAACGVVDFDFVSVLQVVGHNLGHEQRNLVGRVELARLFTGIGGKHVAEYFCQKRKIKNK